jgi:hypothetical protein
MAIRRKDRPEYLVQLAEVRQNTYFGYGEKVFAAAQKSGNQITHKEIYRVVSGQLKSWEILNLIKAVLAEEI